MKNEPVLLILSNFPNDQKLTNSLQPYFRVVLGSKRVDLNQPESGVFTRKLQFELIRVDSNQPGLEAVCECSVRLLGKIAVYFPPRVTKHCLIPQG